MGVNDAVLVAVGEIVLPVKLIVIPEGALQGFTDEVFDWDHEKYANEIAIDIPGPETDMLGKLAKEFNAYVVATAKSHEPEFPGLFFNNVFMISPHGKVVLRHRKNSRVNRDEAILAQTGIRALRQQPVFTTPNVFPPPGFTPDDAERDPEIREAITPQNCYVCKQDFSTIDSFYDQMCPECAKFNYFKRTELADLSGRVALLTGGRVKIGYQTGLKLPRSCPIFMPSIHCIFFSLFPPAAGILAGVSRKLCFRATIPGP